MERSQDKDDTRTHVRTGLLYSVLNLTQKYTYVHAGACAHTYTHIHISARTLMRIIILNTYSCVIMLKLLYSLTRAHVCKMSVCIHIGLLENDVLLHAP